MNATVTLWSSTDSTHTNVFTVRVATVQRAVDALPRLLEIHLKRPHIHCPLDSWTVHTVHASTNLPRVQRRGAIRDGTAITETAGHDQVAD